jgi:hypothetical protein
MSRIALGSLAAIAWVALSAPIAHAGWDSKGRPYQVNTQSAASQSQSAAPAHSGTPESALTALQDRQARVDQLMQGKTGAAESSALASQKRELEALIERMRAGQQVDPSEINRLMNAAPR